MVRDKSASSIVLDIVAFCFCIIVFIITLFPFMNIISTSISGNHPVMTGQVGIWPQDVTFEAYGRVLSNGMIPNAFLNSVIYTVANTAYGVLLTVMLAYPLAKKSFILRRPIWVMLMGAIYFSGGMIPLFIQIVKFGYYDTIWAQVIPCAIAVGNLMLLRIFINDIPSELEESALLDGANNVQVFFKIILPLMTPGIATITLYCLVWKWNDYYNPMMYFSTFEKYPLTVILRELVIKGSFTEKFMNLSDRGTLAQVEMQTNASAYATRLQYAALLVTLLPIFGFYPILQKYFIKGLNTGAVKG